MPPQGEVARQWFIPGEGIDRNVISTDIQRYLGNDATVRPGAGTGEYQGVSGYWIKAYRNLTSAMIADLRADSQRWRQEQRQTGVGSSYVGSTTFNESNAAGIARSSPSLDGYGNPVPRPMEGRAVDSRRPLPGQMDIDPPAGRTPQGQGYNQQGYYQQDARGQFPQDPSRGYPGQPAPRDARPQRDPGYNQQDYNPYPSPAATVSEPARRDPFANPQNYNTPPVQYDQYGQPVPTQRRPQGYPQDEPMAGYGQPDQYGRYAVNQTYGQDRGAQGYGQPVQGPPPGYVRQGDYWVQMTTGYEQPGMMATAGPGQQYHSGQQPPQQGRGQNQGYSGYPQDPGYAPQSRDSNHGRQAPPAQSDDRQRRRNR